MDYIDIQPRQLLKTRSDEEMPSLGFASLLSLAFLLLSSTNAGPDGDCIRWISDELLPNYNFRNDNKALYMAGTIYEQC
jgi:hypothetical protein